MAGSVLVVQYPLGWIVEIVELPVHHGPEQQPREYPPEPQHDRQEKQDRAHQVLAFRTRPSTRAALQRTMALETGISTAATSGFTSPETAAPTARIL